MRNFLEKGLSYSNYIYQFFILNSLFLITNVLFFQFFFAIDFRLIFFPLFFLVSQTIIPSCVASVRYLNKLLKNESTRIFYTFCKELIYTVKHEWKIWMACILCIFLTLATLYVPLQASYVTNVFTMMNVIVFCIEVLMVIIMIGNAQKYEGKTLLLFCMINFFKQIPLSVLMIVLMAALIIAVQKISFMFILFIFSTALYFLYFLFRANTKSIRLVNLE